jgi:lipoprotein-anchoring transpeptidase ErfK/SrfK
VATAPSCAPGARRQVTSDRDATILYVTAPTQARRRPRPRSHVVAKLGPTNTYGVSTVLLALDAVVGRNCAPRWYLAKLPAKPNGVVGWVPAAAVVTGSTDRRVVADLSRRLVVVYRDGRAVFRAHIAVGTAATPTPTGRFFIESRFKITDPAGPYGPAALAVAAYSDADQGWTRGNPIAFHGTDAPASIGTAASHGCLRMHNADVLRMMSLVPAGTPVVIRA